MMPLQAVGWKSTLTPRSSATFFATSISNSMSSPLFERMAQGTKVALPTTSVPRFLIVSMSPSCAAAAAAAPSTNTIAESHLVIDRTTCPSLLPPAYRLRLNRASTKPAANDSVTVRAR